MRSRFAPGSLERPHDGKNGDAAVQLAVGDVVLHHGVSPLDGLVGHVVGAHVLQELVLQMLEHAHEAVLVVVLHLDLLERVDDLGGGGSRLEGGRGRFGVLGKEGEDGEGQGGHKKDEGGHLVVSKERERVGQGSLDQCRVVEMEVGGCDSEKHDGDECTHLRR